MIYFENGFSDQEVFFDFPYKVEIDPDALEDKSGARKWLETHCNGSVYIKTRHYNTKRSTNLFDPMRSIFAFCFELEDDAAAFKLRWC